MDFLVVHAAGIARSHLGHTRTRWALERTVAFELEVSELRGQFKLSQDHARPNRRGVIQGLQGMPDDGSREIAPLMAALELRTQP